ncbi:MAG TPA: Crp/Fnr family transcriptional regulator [Ferruginibacter sp.]|nr:Crp/Fnr family transcriptional regulator [Ferruginibacter sp.]
MKNQGAELNCGFCDARLSSVFKELKGTQLQEMNEHKSCVHFKKGQSIFNENATPFGLYCVNQGKIKLTTAGIDGKEQILRLSKAGDILGYRALLSGEHYNSAAIALEDSSVCFLPKEVLYSLLDDNKLLGFEMMKLLSNDLKQAEQQIVSLSQKNVRERTAEALLFLKATYGLLEDKTIAVSLTREEIADFVGTATESVIRILSEFNTDKIIQLDGKKIRILDLPKLLKTANIED